VHGRDRNHALARLRLALQEFVVEPIPTTLDLHKRLLDAPAIQTGEYSIKWLEQDFFSSDS
jgi:acetyl-CoA carboxylase biotin carboxylase subunit